MRLPELLPVLLAIAEAIAWYKFASCSGATTSKATAHDPFPALETVTESCDGSHPNIFRKWVVDTFSICDNVPVLANVNWLLTTNSGVVVLVTVVVVEVSVVLVSLMLVALVVVKVPLVTDVLVALVEVAGVDERSMFKPSS
jgi:hypothetical protein